MSFKLSPHWGELEDVKRNEDWGLSLSDIEEQLLPSSPPPSLYQPSQEETASFQILPTEMYRSDPLVLNTIRLLQHQRQLLQLLTRAQTFGIDISATPPTFPEDPPVKRKPVKFHYLNFMPPNDIPFTLGTTKPQKYEIEGSTARLILRKAVATLCAHTGYTDTTESVLKVLTDVTHDFLTKVTGVLRANKDSMMLTGNCPFHGGNYLVKVKSTLATFGLLLVCFLLQLNSFLPEEIVDQNDEILGSAILSVLCNEDFSGFK